MFTHQGATAGKLQLTGRPVVPQPGESLRSVVNRTCFENGLPNNYGLLGPLGLLNRNRVRVAEENEISEEDLAYAMRLPSEEISSRKYAALDLEYVDFFGLQISKMRVTNRRRRFSPTAFKHAPFHRALWELKDLPFCLETWEGLIDSCPCPYEDGPTIQRWTRTGSRVNECDKCGFPLSTVEAPQVPEELRSDLAILARLVSPELSGHRKLESLFPKAIAKTDRSRLFDCVRLLTEIAKGGRIEGLDNQFADTILRWQQACVALRNWPRAFPGDWIGDQTPTSAYSYRREVYLALSVNPTLTLIEFKKRTRSYRSVSKAQTPPPKNTDDVRATGRAACAAGRRQKYEAGREKRESERAARRIGLRPASEAAKLDPGTLLQAREEGLLRSFERRHGSKILPAFDRAEVVEFGQRWNARIPVHKLAFDFGITHYGIEQLAALGVLQSSGPRFQNEQPHFTDDDVAKFRERMIKLDSSSKGPWISLGEAMRRIDNRAKPWGSALAAILDATSPFPCRLPRLFDGNLSTIEIPESKATTIACMSFDRDQFPVFNFSNEMVQRDVCEMFNLNESKAAEISFLPSFGVNPKRYDLNLIERERAKLVSSSELSRSFGLDWREIRKAMMEHGATAIHRKFYERTSAIHALTRF